jgi:dihydrofolate synthase/folylpolyglutamate synthase
MAFSYYAKRGCDIVVLETGLGGRLDSTNIIGPPVAAVITAIGYDHMDVLGGTLTDIAMEKAGIIKPGCDVVLYPQEAQIDALFARVCSERDAVLHRVDPAELRPQSFDMDGQSFDYRGH